MKRLGLVLIGLAVFSLMFVVACAAGETKIVEVVKEVVVEKIVEGGAGAWRALHLWPLSFRDGVACLSSRPPLSET